MLWALLGVLLFSSMGGGFQEKMFGKDTQALVREVVSDPARAEVATRTLKQGDKDLKAIAKELTKITKAFSKTDESQSAGVDELTPFVEQVFEKRRIAQEKSLDRIFELRQTLTEEEWGKVFEKLK
jgi:hypothetical protein